VGILLCRRDSGEEIDLRDEPTQRRFEEKRRAIVRKEIAFGALLESENLICDVPGAVYFDHWITPEIYSMRFDTRFYIALLPAHQSALTRSEEVTHSVWIKPEHALGRMHRQDFPILPPTTTVLHRLADLATWKRLRSEFDLSSGS
jgi:hypothetical protein